MTEVVLAIFAIILISNIIQGITGFAGTLLAMPFMILILGLDNSKQILNYCGIIAGIIILAKHMKYVNFSEVRKVLEYMGIGIIIGLLAFEFLPTNLLLQLFPFFILYIGGKGIWLLLQKKPKEEIQEKNKQQEIAGRVILFIAGIIHGIFISGGPLLVSYMTKRKLSKDEFRATLSFIWLILNSFILVQNMILGNITIEIVQWMMFSTIPLILGVIIGGILLKRMSQRLFMLISYILLIFSSISLLIK